VLLLVVLAVAAGGAMLFGWPRFQARRERAEGLRVARDGRFADAEPLLRGALDRDPADVEVVKALALGHLGVGQLADAETDLSRWCTLRPDDPQPFKLRMDERHRRARAAPAADDKQRLLREALADGQRVLRLDAGEDVAPEVVWLLVQVGRFDEADRLCRRCRERQPDDAWLSFLLAKIGHARGAAAGDEPRILLDGLVRQFPQFAPGLLLRAVLYNEAGEPEKAIPLLRQVAAQDRDDRQEARYQLGLALARTGQTEEAERLLAEVQRDNLDRLQHALFDPDVPELKLQLAEACLAADQEAEALRLLNPLLEQQRSSRAAHTLLAAYYERKGQTERAAEHRRQSVP
jgi:predicted Zn-dependent protease